MASVREHERDRRAVHAENIQQETVDGIEETEVDEGGDDDEGKGEEDIDDDDDEEEEQEEAQEDTETDEYESDTPTPWDDDDGWITEDEDEFKNPVPSPLHNVYLFEYRRPCVLWKLSGELLSMILRRLDLPSLLNIALTCRAFHSILYPAPPLPPAPYWQISRAHTRLCGYPIPPPPPGVFEARWARLLCGTIRCWQCKAKDKWGHLLVTLLRRLCSSCAKKHAKRYSIWPLLAI